HMWPSLKIGGRAETWRGFSLVANMSARVQLGTTVWGAGIHTELLNSVESVYTTSVEFTRKDNIACIFCIQEPWTRTSHGRSKEMLQGKLFTREFSVQKLLSVIDNAKKSDNGKFFAWDGQEIPWARPVYESCSDRDVADCGTATCSTREMLEEPNKSEENAVPA
ncbi:hypothetical protein EJB05_00425, partial [Eragrostis curvula]